MTQKGFSAGEILREANRKLGLVLPKGYFCCASIVAMNFRKATIEFWNGGLPPGCVVRPGAGKLIRLDSLHLPLGILDDARFNADTRLLDMSYGDKLVMCTDGIVEARNERGEAFGYERFDAIVQRVRQDGDAFASLKREVYGHIGGTGRDDDLTLVQVAMVRPEQVDMPAESGRRRERTSAEQWQLRYELGPRSLQASNPLPLLQHIIMEFPQLRPQAGAIHTVLAELYSNALEHGVMGLDSGLKGSAEGFSEYYAARRRALENLDGWVRFDFRCESDGLAGNLAITVTDSGPGFDWHTRVCERVEPDQQRGYYGRGVNLLRSLCASLTYRGRGNEVEARFAWSGNDE
jgi:anti-sigma regulatory factor (Ser/Thr protein kinase)